MNQKSSLPRSTAPNQEQFFRLARLGSAVAFGVLGSSMAALEKTSSGLVLKFNLWVIPACLAGAALAWGYWGVAIEQWRQNQPGKNRVFRLYTLVLMLAAAFCFLYPIRFVAESQLAEIFTGLAMALFALSMIAVLVISLFRLLDDKPDQK